MTTEGNNDMNLGEGHHPGHRLSYTEATGSKLYAPPGNQTNLASSRSVTINNPTYSGRTPDDNFV